MNLNDLIILIIQPFEMEFSSPIFTNQISTLYKEKDTRELLLNLFTKNLRKFISRERVEEIFTECFSEIPVEGNTPDDTVIYSCFRNVIKSIQKLLCKTPTESGASQKTREESPNEHIAYYKSSSSTHPVNPYIKKKWWVSSRESSRQQDIFQFYNKKPKKYLDLGGGDGLISSHIGKYLQLKKENIVCADVETWLGNTRKEGEDILYIKLKEGEKLPFKDGEFSLITCFQSLHHMKNIELVISELYRILEPGGNIIIREHDCENTVMKMLIDIEHCIFECVLKDNATDLINSYYGEYKSKHQWSFLFSKYNLNFCHRRYNFKINRNNPTKYYYAMYYKNYERSFH